MKSPQEIHISFQRRVNRVDWRKLAAVDITALKHHFDFNTLQENITNVTFCNIELDFSHRDVDPNLIKLFQLAQLIIEYLIHTQEYLANKLAIQEEELTDAIKEIEQFKLEKDKHLSQIAELKVEIKKSRKLLSENPAEVHRCVYCTKGFISSSYLIAHIQRRHPGLSIPTPQLPVALPVATQVNATADMELAHLREKIHQTDQLFMEEKMQMETKLELCKREFDMKLAQCEARCLEQKRNHLQEMAKLKADFQVELQNTAQSRFADTTLLKNKELTEQILKQESEVCHLQEQLQQETAQSEQFKTNVEVRIRQQEQHWKTKFQQIQQKHTEEMNQLRGFIDRIRREGRRISSRHANQIEDLQAHTVENDSQITHLQSYMRPKSASVPHLHVVTPSPAEDTWFGTPNETIVKEAKSERKRQTPVRKSVLRLKSPSEYVIKTGSENNENSTPDNASATPFSAIKTLEDNPQIITALREDVKDILDKKLETVGIPSSADGISLTDFKEKLQILRQERQKLAKQVPGFQSLRNSFESEVNTRTVQSTEKKGTPKGKFAKLVSLVKRNVLKKSSMEKSISLSAVDSSPAVEETLPTPTANKKKSVSMILTPTVYGTEDDDSADSDNASSFSEPVRSKIHRNIQHETAHTDSTSKEETPSVSEASASFESDEDVNSCPGEQQSQDEDDATPQQSKVALLSKTIEQQMSAPRKKPFGGVSTLYTNDKIEDDIVSILSLEEQNKAA